MDPFTGKAAVRLSRSARPALRAATGYPAAARPMLAVTSRGGTLAPARTRSHPQAGQCQIWHVAHGARSCLCRINRAGVSAALRALAAGGVIMRTAPWRRRRRPGPRASSHPAAAGRSGGPAPPLHTPGDQLPRPGRPLLKRAPRYQPRVLRTQQRQPGLRSSGRRPWQLLAFPAHESFPGPRRARSRISLEARPGRERAGHHDAAFVPASIVSCDASSSGRRCLPGAPG